MNYTMKFNDNGDLIGYQEVNYDLCGMKVSDHLFYMSGVYIHQMSFVQVFDARLLKSYIFNVSDWGCIENCRDQAEIFSCSGGNYNYSVNGSSWKLTPVTEEQIVL